jgi:hypothetical protein
MLRSLSAACLAAAVFLLAIAPAEAQRSRALRGEKAETLQVDVRNKTQPTLCAEDDNVYLTLTNRKVRHFRVEARPPAVIGTIVQDSRAPDFTDCTIKDQPPGPEDKVDRIVLFEDDTMMLVGFRHSEFWRKGNVPLRVGDREEKSLHLVQLFTKTPKGPYEFLVLYPLDGYWRARPLPPERLDEVAYGTSFLVGEIQEKDRPYVELKSVRFVPKSKTFELTFGDDELGTLRVIEISDKVASFDVSLSEGVRSRPFAALRSMYITDVNADASHVAWKGRRGKGWESRPISDFRNARTDELWLGRFQASRHNTSAPDTSLKQFAPE